MTLPAQRGRRLIVLAGAFVGASVASASCDSIPTNPSTVFSMTVDSPPSPSVVAGDTLRDTNGVAAPLTAQAYNSTGQVLKAPVQFITLTPTLLTITASNLAIASKSGDSVARVVAQTQSLQSLPFTLPVVLQPDSIRYPPGDSDSVTTVSLSLTNPDSNVSPSLDIQLKHIPDTVGGDSVTRTYILHYQITYPASAAKGTGTPSDTLLLAYLTDANGNPARTDTTDANGLGSRFIKINVVRVPPKAVDSIVAVATALYRKTPVGGSPLRFVVHYFGPDTSSSGSARVGRPATRCARGPCHGPS